MADDSVVGVTSNPTIFQKALAEGDLYDEQLREVAATTDDTVEIFFALAMDDIREACDLMHPVWERTDGIDGYVSLEVDPTLAYEREQTFEQACGSARRSTGPNLYVKIPATEPGLGAIEDCIAKGVSINVTLIFSLERYAAVAEAYLRGLERLVAGGGDPQQGAVRRELLRLPRRHRGGQAPRGARPHRPAGQARGREREARLPALPRRVRRRPLGVSRPQGRASAALPVGVDLGQEPRLPRRDLRRGADRPRHRQHDAARDGARVPGSRRGEAATASTAGIDEANALLADLAAAGVDYDDVVATLEAEGVQKFADSFVELLDGIRAKVGSLATA